LGFSSKDKEIEYRKKYYQENKKNIALKNKMYYKKHSENIKLRTKKYKQDHKIETYEQMKLYGKKYRIINKIKITTRRKERENNLRLKVIDYYSNGKMCCSCCNENTFEFLTIDHIDNNGSKHRKEIGNDGVSIISWLINNDFPEGFQILCYNCNCARSKQIDKICPHKKNTDHDSDRFNHARGDTCEGQSDVFESAMSEPKLSDYDDVVIRILDVSKSVTGFGSR
jgi:hypothetical protein